MEEKALYDDYITFLLIGDNFAISKTLREMAGEFGMDEIYNACQYIATKFEEYDKDKYNYYSQYESLERFLKEYDKEIKYYIYWGTEFKIKKEDKEE